MKKISLALFYFLSALVEERTMGGETIFYPQGCMDAKLQFPCSVSTEGAKMWSWPQKLQQVVLFKNSKLNRQGEKSWTLLDGIVFVEKAPEMHWKQKNLNITGDGEYFLYRRKNTFSIYVLKGSVVLNRSLILASGLKFTRKEGLSDGQAEAWDLKQVVKLKASVYRGDKQDFKKEVDQLGMIWRRALIERSQQDRQLFFQEINARKNSNQKILYEKKRRQDESLKLQQLFCQRQFLVEDE